MTLALVSSRRNSRLRAQTIFTLENQHFLVQMAPQASWPPDVPTASLEARSPQPGVLSQASSARIPQPGVLSKDSSARKSQSGILSQGSSARSPQPAVSSQSVWGPRWSHFLILEPPSFEKQCFQSSMTQTLEWRNSKKCMLHIKGAKCIELSCQQNDAEKTKGPSTC